MTLNILNYRPNWKANSPPRPPASGCPLRNTSSLPLSSAGRRTPMPRTGAEIVAYWERGRLIGTRPDITDPSEHAHALREKAEKRSRSATA